MGHVLYLFQVARVYHREGDTDKITRSLKALEGFFSAGNAQHDKNNCVFCTFLAHLFKVHPQNRQ